jgi:hypothetical protein
VPGIGLLPEFVWVIAETAVRGAPPVARAVASLFAVARPAVIRSISALVNILGPPEFCRLVVSQPATIAVAKAIALNLKDRTFVLDSPGSGSDPMRSCSAPIPYFGISLLENTE